MTSASTGASIYSKNSGTAAFEHMAARLNSASDLPFLPHRTDPRDHHPGGMFDWALVATHSISSYTTLSGRARHRSQETNHLDGAVESSVQLGVADLIADAWSPPVTTLVQRSACAVFAEPLLQSKPA